jgi:hypothetical protein
VRARRWLFPLLVLGALVALTGPSAFADPPGNNGTVKIDGQPFDTAPDNEPHVGCTFQVDFYGYDQGDLNATVTFQAWAPTGEDPAGGGTDLDAERTYTLDFTGFTPEPNQGFHVKLTVNAEGSIGADVKHKVFWVEGCGGYAPQGVSSAPAAAAGDVASTTPTSHSNVWLIVVAAALGLAAFAGLRFVRRTRSAPSDS